MIALKEEIVQEWVKRTDSDFTPDMLSSLEVGVKFPRPAIAFPTWDRTSDSLKIVYYMRLLQRRADEIDGSGRAFTLNVSPAVEELAKTKKVTFLKFMQERVAQRLKAEMGEACWYWFTIEVSPAGRPHLHGCFAAEPSQLAGIERAFLSVARVRGVKNMPRTYQPKAITDAAGWVDYVTKERLRSRAKFVARGLAIDKLISANQDLRKRAQAAYEDDYKSFWWCIDPRKVNPMYGMF